jgi:nitroreductase
VEVIEGIETRKSHRAFESTPIPEETIERILSAARRSPSYTNTQPWEVAVVCGNKKDELSKILFDMAKSGVAANPDLPFPKTWPEELGGRAKEHSRRRFEVMGVRPDDVQRKEEIRLQNYQFYGAPCVIFLFMDGDLTSWSVFDMGLFTQSIVLAAHALGLGSCIQASITGYSSVIREFLGIPPIKSLVLGISIGYPDMESPVNSYQSNRAGLDQFVKFYS